MRAVASTFVVSLAAALGGCTAQSPSLNVAFDARGGGTFTCVGAASVESFVDAGPSDVKGATVRAQTFAVTTWHGEFRDWRAADVFGVTFECATDADGAVSRLIVPLRPAADWFRRLVPSRSATERVNTERDRLDAATECVDVLPSDLEVSQAAGAATAGTDSERRAARKPWDPVFRIVVPGRIARGQAFVRSGQARLVVPEPERPTSFGGATAVNSIELQLPYDLIATSDATLVFEVSYVPDAAVEAAASRRATTRPGSAGR